MEDPAAMPVLFAGDAPNVIALGLGLLAGLVEPGDEWVVPKVLLRPLMGDLGLSDASIRKLWGDDADGGGGGHRNQQSYVTYARSL